MQSKAFDRLVIIAPQTSFCHVLIASFLKKEVCEAILTDLSKAFDCISHDLLMAKLNAYGFDQNALNDIHNYLFGRSQRTKVGFSFSDLLGILYGVPQGSILDPLLFNINICDLFLSDYSSEFTNFTGDTTPYECGENYYEVINKLEDTIEISLFINVVKTMMR